MKPFCLLVAFIGISSLFAQKKAVDFASMPGWEWFTERRISDDGQWIAYGTAPDESKYPLLRVSNSQKGIELHFPGAGRCNFAADNLTAFLYAGIADAQPDTLVVLNLQTGEQSRYRATRELKWARLNSRVYAFKTDEPASNTLYLHSPWHSSLLIISAVSQFWLTEQGEDLVYTLKQGEKTKLIRHHIPTGKETVLIDNTTNIGNLAFDSNSTSMACVADSAGLVFIVQLSLEKLSVVKLPVVIADHHYQLSSNSSIRFINNRYLLFSSTYDHRNGMTPTDASDAKMELWSYTDDRIYPLQKKELNKDLTKEYYFLYDIQTRATTQITDLNVDEMQLPQDGSVDRILLTTSRTYRRQLQWDPIIRSDAYMLEMPNGQRTPVAINKMAAFSLSPGGRYVVWFDREKQAYYSYSTSSRQIKNISVNVTDALADLRPQLPQAADAFGIAGWEEGDRSLLIATNFDVWKLDPSGGKPINQTRGYARRNNISLSFYAPRRSAPAFAATDTLLFYGTQLHNKSAGFFAVTPGHTGTPDQLIFGQYSFAFPGMALAEKSNEILLSFGNNNNYGLFKTRDLIHFDTVYLLNPQKKDFNWYTGEVFRWKNKQGHAMEGALYKPENFDPKKKYPIIVWLYENDNASKINSYLIPKWSGSIIDFPFYASNGYLLFLPDISYKMGQPGQSACDAVLSGIDALGQNAWADTSRMGLQSHSWGGYQVLYILTKTSRFKAALAGAAVANMTSAYGSLRTNLGESRQWIYEKHQSRLGASLWQRPDLFINNSPLFHVPAIHTPLLLLHNEKDGIVPFSQAIELYTALVRNGKTSWLLNYPDENHGLTQMNNKKDFSQRMFQFFEHYLKKAPAPEWMQSGIPAVKQGWRQMQK
jgi:dipeptidyl aminopeptidase/acylaminoacyl peptidase